MITLITASFLMSGCAPPSDRLNAVESSTFEGYWYGIRAQGVTTFHSDSHFASNGEIEVRFYSCLSTALEYQWIDKGTWIFEDNILTVTLVSNSGNESDGQSYTHQYSLLEERFDQRVFRSETDNYEFWLHRRWHDQPYSCDTSKADTESDRNKAIADGRFESVYPDYIGTDS